MHVGRDMSLKLVGGKASGILHTVASEARGETKTLQYPSKQRAAMFIGLPYTGETTLHVRVRGENAYPNPAPPLGSVVYTAVLEDVAGRPVPLELKARLLINNTAIKEIQLRDHYDPVTKQLVVEFTAPDKEGVYRVQLEWDDLTITG